MRYHQVGNKADTAFIVVRNSLTVDFPLGSPLFFVMNGTNDGLDVVNAVTAAGAKQEFLAGIASSIIAAGLYGESQVFGICPNTRVATNSRAASTDSYNSMTAIVVGDVMQINTLTDANAISRSAAGAATAALPNIIAAQAYTSTASQSSSFDTTSRTVITTMLKTFLRCM